MATPAVRYFFTRILPTIALLVPLLASLHLMSGAVQNSIELGRLYVPLLLFSIFGLVILVVLIAFQLVRLLRQYRRREAGSRLTARMVLLFVALSAAPLSVVYYYSLGFLMQGIDSWFDVQIDEAMEDVLALSRASLDLHKRERLKRTEQALLEVEGASEAAMALSLGELRERYGAWEFVLISFSGRLIASSNEDPTILVPERLDNAILQQVRRGEGFVGLTAREGDASLLVRVAVADPYGRNLVLQALYMTSSSVTALSGKVQGAYTRYKELAYLRQSLKFSFTLTLSLVLLFAMLTAVWAAFLSARRLVKPVADIAAGTRAVAEGDYDKQLPLPKSLDELSFLVASFNAMTRRISMARDQAGQSQRQVEAQRAYLQTVLGCLSSGVVAVDAELYLRTANQAAHQILQVDLDQFMGRPLADLATVSPRLQQFVDAVQAPLLSGNDEWREEITLFGGDSRQVLLCRSTPMTRPEGDQSGQVLVFDDITALIKAQRDAAWGEVARRLAHEIKNPLTPIQLSAERIRHKYLKQMGEEDARLLDRSTHTIVQQVEAMKEMVNAFADFARPPQMNAQPVVLDALVEEVLELYRASSEADFSWQPGAQQGRINGDPVRLRQVVHNLIKNAQEAVVGQTAPRVELASQEKELGDCRFVELKIEDNGPGIDTDVLGQVFEPYVTTKSKGTGLGLAIVKKIIEEHGGMIRIENRTGGGCCVALRLPLLSEKGGSRCVEAPSPAVDTEVPSL
jgi:nitrogen fixation/metabolism regulation signal transduction histidine kinase